MSDLSDEQKAALEQMLVMAMADRIRQRGQEEVLRIIKTSLAPCIRKKYVKLFFRAVHYLEIGEVDDDNSRY